MNPGQIDYPEVSILFSDNTVRTHMCTQAMGGKYLDILVEVHAVENIFITSLISFRKHISKGNAKRFYFY